MHSCSLSISGFQCASVFARALDPSRRRQTGMPCIAPEGACERPPDHRRLRPCHVGASVQPGTPHWVPACAATTGWGAVRLPMRIAAATVEPAMPFPTAAARPPGPLHARRARHLRHCGAGCVSRPRSVANAFGRGEGVDRVEVGGAGEGARVGRVLLTHRALHLRHRFVLALEPAPDALQHFAQRLRSALQQGTGQVHHVGAGEQHLEGVVSDMDTAGRGQRDAGAAAQDGNPAHREQGVGRG